MSSILTYQHGVNPKNQVYWQKLPDGRVQCDLCPRSCQLKEGQRGACFARGNRDGEVVLLNYGRSSGFCIDPIEKKPLNHFYPGTSVLSFGTAGCNLACKFCQNWDISKASEVETLSDMAMPDSLAEAAAQHGCKSIAFTYNDPVIFHEYAIDVADAARAAGILAVAVTAGYMNPEPRREFFSHMDAANVDLKAFTDRFYHRICAGRLAPVLDTLEYLHHETNVWFEITNLLIPGENDSDREIEQMAAWIATHLSCDVPIHFTAFHPDYRMRSITPTSAETLTRARRIALNSGLRFVYTGNVHDITGGSTYCPACDHAVIERDWYQLGDWHLDQNGCCDGCGAKIPGRFSSSPGDHGPRREVIRIN